MMVASPGRSGAGEVAGERSAVIDQRRQILQQPVAALAILWSLRAARTERGAADGPARAARAASAAMLSSSRPSPILGLCSRR